MTTGRSRRGLELVAERFVAPVDVRGVVDGRLCGVDEAGGGDTGAAMIFSAPTGSRSWQRRRLRSRAGRRPGSAPVGCERIAPVLVDEGAGDLGSADINADRVHVLHLSSWESWGVCSQSKWVNCGVVRWETGVLAGERASKLSEHREQHPLECSKPASRRAKEHRRRAATGIHRPPGTKGVAVKQIRHASSGPRRPRCQLH